MKSAILAAITCCTIAGFAIGASTPPPAQKKAVTPAKKTAAAPAVVKKGSPPARTAVRTPAKTPPPSFTRPTTTKRYYGRQPVRAAYHPANYHVQQSTPTSDRFREIQDALAAKGYLKTPSSGLWDKDSMDAMQRFQKDQNLDATGKLTARSLGALGLGPKTPLSSSTEMPPSASANPATAASPFQ